MRWLQVGMVVAIFISLGFSAWLWQASLEQKMAAEAVEAAAAKLQASNVQLNRDLSEEGLTLKALQLADLKREIIFANHMSAKRDLSWARLLSDLEEATPPHVSYSSVQFNYKDATVTLIKDAQPNILSVRPHLEVRKA